MKKYICAVPLILLLCLTFAFQDKAAMAELEKFRARAKTEDQNSTLAEKVMAAWDKGDFDTIKKIVAPGYHTYAPSRSTKPYSIDEEIEWVKSDSGSFPDFSMTIKELFAAGDKVVLRYVCKGTHSGEFHGIPATGKKVEFGGIIIFYFENGRLVETREENDYVDIGFQLGMELKPKEAKKK